MSQQIMDLEKRKILENMFRDISGVYDIYRESCKTISSGINNAIFMNFLDLIAIILLPDTNIAGRSAQSVMKELITKYHPDIISNNQINHDLYNKITTIIMNFKSEMDNNNYGNLIFENNTVSEPNKDNWDFLEQKLKSQTINIKQQYNMDDISELNSEPNSEPNKDSWDFLEQKLNSQAINIQQQNIVISKPYKYENFADIADYVTQEYIAGVKNKAWGTGVELHALANVFHVNIYVKTANYTTDIKSDDPNAENINIIYLDGGKDEEKDGEKDGGHYISSPDDIHGDATGNCMYDSVIRAYAKKIGHGNLLNQKTPEQYIKTLREIVANEIKIKKLVPLTQLQEIFNNPNNTLSIYTGELQKEAIDLVMHFGYLNMLENIKKMLNTNVFMYKEMAKIEEKFPSAEVIPKLFNDIFNLFQTIAPMVNFFKSHSTKQDWDPVSITINKLEKLTSQQINYKQKDNYDEQYGHLLNKIANYVMLAGKTNKLIEQNDSTTHFTQAFKALNKILNELLKKDYWNEEEFNCKNKELDNIKKAIDNNQDISASNEKDKTIQTAIYNKCKSCNKYQEDKFNLTLMHEMFKALDPDGETGVNDYDSVIKEQVDNLIQQIEQEENLDEAMREKVSTFLTSRTKQICEDFIRGNFNKEYESSPLISDEINNSIKQCVLNNIFANINEVCSVLIALYNPDECPEGQQKIYERIVQIIKGIDTMISDKINLQTQKTKKM